MEAYAVNGAAAAAAAAADQDAPDLAAAVQAADAGATATLADLHHAMPLVAFDPQAVTTPEEAAAAAAAIAAAAGAMVGSEMSPAGMHMSGGAGGLAGRGRLSLGSFKNRTGAQYCQVEGCGMPLEGLKEYHQRYKVCEDHLKLPYIMRDGQQVRFCQQCGRFQPLEEFDDNKRSCRVRLQRHNARRRKRPREAGGGMGDGHMSEYGTSVAAAEMAKLAAQSYAAVGGLAGPNAVSISPKDVQAMHDALHFASTTLIHSNQMKGTGEEGGEEGGEAAGSGMGLNSMPFVPTPDVMMLLLKGYAAMFHYVLDSATIRALAAPSDLPDQQAAAGSLGALDALQMQQLMQAQGLFGAAEGGIGGMGGLPMLLSGGEMAAAGMLAAAQGQEEMGGGDGGGGGEEAEGEEGGAGDGGEMEAGGEGHEQQNDHDAQHAQHAVQHAQQAEQAQHGSELTAEQVAAALIHPLPSDAAAAEGAMAAAAALAAAAGGHYMGGMEAAGEQQQMGQAALQAAALQAHQQQAAEAADVEMAQQAQQGGGDEEADGEAGGSAEESEDTMPQ